MREQMVCEPLAHGARGGEKIRQMRRFAESDKELARFYRENA
jgi:hypothetical protein